MIAAAERVGRLPHALARLTRRHTRRLDEDTADDSFYRAYPFLMVLVICSAVALICVFVIPKFESIFADFGLKLPPMTEAMLWAARELGPWIAILASITLLLWFVVGLWRMFDPHMTKWTGPRRVRDHIAWVLPVSHSLARDRGLADSLDLIHQAVRSGYPMDRAVEQASTLRVNEVLRHRLARWASELRGGMSLHQSADTAGLPRLVVEMLAPIHGGEQAADVLNFLSRYYDARFSRLRVLLRAASIPITVLFFAVIVACIALALMTPLVSLINSISQEVAPRL
jgi:type IV pilus assembly protein PilC